MCVLGQHNIRYRGRSIPDIIACTSSSYRCSYCLVPAVDRFFLYFSYSSLLHSLPVVWVEDTYPFPVRPVSRSVQGHATSYYLFVRNRHLV